jgi:hypothetical protein
MQKQAYFSLFVFLRKHGCETLGVLYGGAWVEWKLVFIFGGAWLLGFLRYLFLVGCITPSLVLPINQVNALLFIYCYIIGGGWGKVFYSMYRENLLTRC